jgi:hypothetical protein
MDVQSASELIQSILGNSTHKETLQHCEARNYSDLIVANHDWYVVDVKAKWYRML